MHVHRKLESTKSTKIDVGYHGYSTALLFR
jgi:hypothetical protein